MAGKANGTCWFVFIRSANNLKSVDFTPKSFVTSPLDSRFKNFIRIIFRLGCSSSFFCLACALDSKKLNSVFFFFGSRDFLSFRFVHSLFFSFWLLTETNDDLFLSSSFTCLALPTYVSHRCVLSLSLSFACLLHTHTRYSPPFYLSLALHLSSKIKRKKQKKQKKKKEKF